MTDRPGFVMQRLARRFERVSFDQRAQERINEAARRGRVVYVCDRESTLDYLYFNYAFLKLSLPLAWFATRMRVLFFRPLVKALGYLFGRLFRRIRVKLPENERLAAAVRADRASLVFLRRRRALLQWGGAPVTDHLRRLVELQPELDEPIQLVPLMVFWDKDPHRYGRNLFDLVFGAPDAPGRIRKLVGFWRFYRHALVQVGEPVDLPSFLAEHQEVGSAPELLAERLRFTLHQDINLVNRPIRGPVLKRARRIREEIVRAESFRHTLERFAEDNGRPLPSVLKEARGYLKEMAADFHIRYVEGFCVVLTMVWNRVFSGLEVDLEGLQRIRAAAQDAPVVFVPAHRSHIDYLAISYVCYAHGLIPPHIAAGINLSFWPMGHIFRNAGAFFLRRSFKGNPLYAKTFAAYIRKLVKEGYWIEFFIEGGRSRTGKCLPPKMGILNDVVQAVLDGASRDVALVPVSIGYERVVEEGAYSRELGGAEKEAEDLKGLLKTAKVLKTRHGRLHVSFQKPLSLQQYMAEQGFTREHAADPAADPDVRRFVNRLGHRLVAEINDTMVVTTTGLVATALLCHPKRGISRERLRMRVGLLLDLVTRQGAPLAGVLKTSLQARRLDVARAEQQAAAVTPAGVDPADVPRYQRQRVIDSARGEAVREVIDAALAQLVGQKLIRAESGSGRGAAAPDAVFAPVPERRLNLDIYKNNLIHRLVPHAFAATAILAAERDGRVADVDVRRHARFLSRMLKLEFIYRDRNHFEEAFAGTRRVLHDLGLLTAAPGEPEAGPPQVALVHPKAHHLLEFFRNITANFLESYRFVALRGPELLEAPMTEKDLLKRLQQDGQRAFREGDLLFRESVSSVNFQNAIAFFVERGALVRDGKRLSLRRPKRYFERWTAHLKTLLPS
jgi:glycerol-3-phosphate O-acyltransferase